MDKKYIAGKTGKMAGQMTGSGAVVMAVYFILKRTGIELTADETVVYAAALNVVVPSIIKFIEKLMKK